MSPSASRAIRRSMLVLSGLGMGLLGVVMGAWFYVEAARVEEVRTDVGVDVRLARESMERIDPRVDSAIRIDLADVVLRGDAGDTVLASRNLTMALDASSLAGEGAIDFFDVRLVDPVARVVQSTSGEWNYERALGLTDPARAAEAGTGRPMLFRDVRLANGDVSIALPAGPEPEEGAAFVADLPISVIGGVRYNEYRIRNVEGVLPNVRIGGPQGWRAEFAGLSADVEQPNLRITSASGWAEQSGTDAVRFDATEIAIGDSRLAGSGLVTFVEDGLLYDVELRGSPLHLANFQPLFPNLPSEGVASFAVDVRSVTRERLALDFTSFDLDALDSRITGRIAIAAGGEVPLALLGADLELAPLRLSALEELGMAADLPVSGVVEGRVTTTEAAEGFAAVDLTATLYPRDGGEADPSVIVAQGTVALGGELEALELDGIAIGLRPLRLETFASLAPEQSDILRGTVEGSVTLGGTMDDVVFRDGSLVYQVGNAPATRLTNLNGRATLVPEMSYEVSAVAEPLTLATITELYPALPLRDGTLSGPITISGNAEGAGFSAALSGPAGGLDVDGSVAFTEPMAFDFGGSVNAFSAGMLLEPDVPVEGPLTGTFAARGTTEDVQFNVDLTQADGRFVLDGTLVPSAGSPRFDLAGEVVSFRIGALLGDPQLFRDPMSGPITLSGGGGEPYTFDFGLRGDESSLMLAGFYLPGDPPTYEAEGSVAGLDLSRLPMRGLPSSSLTATIDVDGRGTDLQTLEGSFAFDATPSTIGGRPLDAALGRVEIRGGIAYIDTLHVEYDRTRFAATGTWGLRNPSAEPLSYSLTSPDLAALGRLFTPVGAVPRRMGGSLQTSGTIAGSIEYPVIDGSFDGRNLRYEDLRATQLRVVMDAARSPDIGWSGEIALQGSDLTIPGGEQLEVVQLEATGNENTLDFDVLVRRNARAELDAAGSIMLVGLSPEALALQDMTLSLERTRWELTNPTQIEFTSDEGAWIDNLVLNRISNVPGSISINGRIPPTGAADLIITAREVDLSDLNQISPTLPPIEGILTLDALLEGPVSDPEMTLRGEVRQLGFEGATAESLSFDGVYAGELMRGTAQAIADGARLFGAEFSVPMRLSFQNMLPVFETRGSLPIAVSIAADSLPLDLVAALVPGVRDGTGVARAMVEIAGSADAPSFEGWARIDNGGLFIEPANVRYTEIVADVALSANRLDLNSFSARSEGTLVVSGWVDFPDDLAPRLSLTAGLDQFRVVDDPELASVGVSGQLSVAGSLENPVLTGSVSIRESTIRVPELAQPEPGIEIGYLDAPEVGPQADEPATVGPAFLGNLQVDGVALGVDESVWLESNEMRVQIAGDLVLYRVADELRVFGALQAVRGTYALEVSAIVREFDVVRGRVQFFGTGDLNPSLDILAGYQTRRATVGRGGDITILVQLSGTLLSPRIQLSADTPVPLSETDIISYLIFGQPSFELGGVNAEFAGQIVLNEVLSGVIASGLERPILSRGLCDWVRVRPGLTSNLSGRLGSGALRNAAIECGWEIGPDLFLTGQTGIGIFGGEFSEGRLGVEWQIDNQWLWEASYGSVERNSLSRIFDTGVRTQFSTDIRRQWEYGRPSQRTPIDLTPEEEAEPPAMSPTSELFESGSP